MKKILILLAILVGTATVSSARVEDKKRANTETVVFDVSLSCENCKARLEKHIPFKKGVKDMDVDLTAKKVSVDYDTRKTTPEAIAKAIEKLGYTCTVAEPD